MTLQEDDIEVWKPVYGYEDRYLVSNFGKVKSTGIANTSGRVLANCHSGQYCRVSLTSTGNKAKSVNVHRLVAIHFVHNPDPINKTWVNHKDLNKINNYWKNLEWCTPDENTHHAVINNAMARGNKLPFAKLNPIAVQVIKEAYWAGHRQTYISSYFKVSQVAIHKVIFDKTWQEKGFRRT